MELRKLLKKVTATLFLSLFSLIAFAQNLTVTGNVKDNTGEPMIGVNVQVVGTTTGAITDLDGNYSIQASPSNKLQFSFIGYVTQTITVNNQRTINVTLNEDAANLDEVIVIGYGTVKKRDLTGSVASVNNETLTANPVSDVSQALQGKLPGVSVIIQDGRPGAEVYIRVRGGGSISQSNDPLFVVDGFPVSSISDIPADQIESIDVLKDASSTAIYGARGANGVILVTTKSAKNEKLSISYNTYFQTKSVAKQLNTLSAQDYVYYTWAFGTALDRQNAMEKYFGLGSNYGNHYNDYADVAVHDYTDDLLRTAYAQSHNISLNGGNEKTKISVGINYIEDEGLKINSDFSRFNASFKLSQEILKNLKFEMDTRYGEVEVTGRESLTNSRGSQLSGAYRWRPIDNPLGDANAISGFGLGADHVDLNYGSPLDYVNDVKDVTNRYFIQATGALSWEIVKGLTARSELNASRNWKEQKYYEDGLSRSYKYARLDKSSGYSLRSATTLNYEVQGLGANHNLSVMLGNEILASRTNSSYMIGAGYPDSFDFNQVFGMFDQADKTKTENKNSTTIGTPEKTVSFFGRVNYSYLGRYLLTGTFRADGSSKFAPNNRWGYFPAGAFAWRISDEPFMQNTQNWLSNLKLRLSYGLAGADNINSSLWKETWESVTVTYNNNNYSGFQLAGLLSNPDLKWETTTSRNLGLDFGFWNNRLSGSIDLYWNTTKDLLMCVPIDETTGYSYQYQNMGQTSNKGIELALNWDIYRGKDWSLGVSATYNYNHNNIDKLADNIIAEYGSAWASSATQPTYDYLFREGSAVGLIRGYISDGFYTTADFDYDPSSQIYTLKKGISDTSTNITGNYPTHFKRPSGQNAFPGALKIRDVDESGVADTGDITDLGEVMPSHTGGFNLNATFKGLDFSAGFTWAAGGHIYNANALVSMFGNKDTGLGVNRLSFVNEAYRIYDVRGGELVPVKDPTELDLLNANAKYAVPFHENGVTYSTFIEDASYLRLNTLTLGYTLPKQWTTKVGMQKVRVYATGGNLFTITGYSGIDPSINSSQTKNQSSKGEKYPRLGLDFGTYPRARTFTFGLNVTF